MPSFSYPSPVTVSENSIVSIPANVSNLSTTAQYFPVAGNLPLGLTLDQNTGEISGDLGAGIAGTYNFTVLLSQAGLPSEFDVTASLEIVVVESGLDLTLHYPDIDVPAGTGPLNVGPTVTGAQGGTLSYAIISGGPLPAELALDPATGYITGNPTTATDGNLSLDVLVTEQLEEGSFTAVSELLVRIQPTLSYAPADGKVGDPITIIPVVSPSAIPGTFAITSGNLPQGLNFDPATGIVSGTPLLPQFEVLTISFTITGERTQEVSAVLGISITNYTDATFTANVIWNVIREGGNPVETHNPVTITCDRDITSASSGNVGNDLRTATAILGDGEFLTITVNTSGGAAACSAAQRIDESGVEIEHDCQERLLEAGSSDSCTFVNTVFFEGVPMLGDRGLAILALLMLGMGIVGVRRFA
jgi:hypothetical protein